VLRCCRTWHRRLEAIERFSIAAAVEEPDAAVNCGTTPSLEPLRSSATASTGIPFQLGVFRTKTVLRGRRRSALWPRQLDSNYHRHRLLHRWAPPCRLAPLNPGHGSAGWRRPNLPPGGARGSHGKRLFERPSPHHSFHISRCRQGPPPGRGLMPPPQSAACASYAACTRILRKAFVAADRSACAPMRQARLYLRQQRLLAGERGHYDPHGTLPRSCSTLAVSPHSVMQQARTHRG